MKRTYLISYDLISPSKNYELLLKKIRSLPDWACLGGSAYIIKSDKSPSEIRNDLLAVMDQNDKIFVGAIDAPAAWFGLSDEVSKWLQNNLR